MCYVLLMYTEIMISQRIMYTYRKGGNIFSFLLIWYEAAIFVITLFERFLYGKFEQNGSSSCVADSWLMFSMLVVFLKFIAKLKIVAFRKVRRRTIVSPNGLLLSKLFAYTLAHSPQGFYFCLYKCVGIASSKYY